MLCVCRFKSNHYESALGFKIRFKSSNVSQWSYNGGECGANFTTPNGLLISPLYQNKYSQNLDCIYYVSSSTGTFLKLTVLSQSSTCFEIRDGHFEYSPLVGEFCGGSIPASILTTQNQARVM